MLTEPGNIYESFFDNSLEGIIIFDSKGRIVNANAMAGKLFGHKPGILNNKSINDLVGKKYEQSLWSICDGLIAGEKGNHKKNLIIPDVGKKKIILNIYFNNHIRSEDGPLIAAIVRDETQRFKDKDEVKQSHERFKKTFHNNPVAQFIVCTTNEKIIDVNRKFLELLGYSESEVLGGNIAAIGISACNCGNQDEYSSNHENPANQCEETIRVKSGELINVRQSYVVFNLNETRYQLWTIIDLTAVKTAESSLKLLNEQLEHKVEERTRDLTSLLEREKLMNDLKSRFVSMASHEFRTPLTTVLVSAGLLETYIQHNEREKSTKHITRIKSAVYLLTEILEDFLSLDKIERAIVKPFTIVFDLHDFAEKILNETEGALKKGQSIEYNVTGNSSVKMDINMLKNIMLNLISNASKYSDEQGRISWSMSVQPGKLLITLADNGIGIPIDDQPFIFSRFFRAKNVEVMQGTGLGLHIARKYAELLHGTITFVSTENVGTTFIVEIPLAE